MIMDRTHIDCIIDEMIDLNSNTPSALRTWGGRPSEIRFYMSADIGTIEERIKNKNEFFNYEYTRAQIDLYSKLMSNQDYFHIDANKDETSIFKDIMKILRFEV